MFSDKPDSFGKRLRLIRKEMGCASPARLAQLLRKRYSVSGILKRERGEIKIDRSYVEDLCKALQVDRTRREQLLSLVDVYSYQFNPWRFHQEGVGAIQFEYWKRVRSAKRYRQFEPLYICALLQTQEYAYEAARTFEIDHAAALDASHARFRMCDTLLDEFRESKKQKDRSNISLIQDEEALYRQIGSKQIMRQQIERIINVLRSDAVGVQILPRNTLQQVPIGYNFNLYDDLLAQLKTACGHVFVTDPDTVALLGRWFAKIQAQSVGGSAALKILERAAKSYRG